MLNEHGEPVKCDRPAVVLARGWLAKPGEPVLVYPDEEEGEG